VGISMRVKAGIIQDYKFPPVTRANLLKSFGDGASAELMVARAEQFAASQRFFKEMDRGEPNRAELRKELKGLSAFFDQVNKRCQSISMSAAAQIRGKGGASNVQFGEIADYFLQQSGAANMALDALPNKKGREKISNKYFFVLVQLAEAHRTIFGVDISISRNSPGLYLAMETLAAGNIPKAAGGQLERMISKAIAEVHKKLPPVK
jgi:hypothetical protein